MADEAPPPMFAYETTPDGRTLVVCTVDGCRGAARINSKGMDDAKARAEAQARDKLAGMPQ
tara:strand:+ start:119 stop:301 length:183 start_codon:yes stop_codon:yes gene_type:complete